MIEQEWLECIDPRPLLATLKKLSRTRSISGRRQLRLLGCACQRRIWHLLSSEFGQKAVELSERYADGRASKKELEQMAKVMRNSGYDVQTAEGTAEYAATIVVTPNDLIVAELSLQYTTWPVEREALHQPVRTVRRAERAVQSSLVRDIFGNPFRPVSLEPTCRIPAVTALAQAIYDEHRFEDLPILADALEEAGRMNDDVLNHCRGPGPHARGCWVIDLILNKS